VREWVSKVKLKKKSETAVIDLSNVFVVSYRLLVLLEMMIIPFLAFDVKKWIYWALFHSNFKQVSQTILDLTETFLYTFW